MNDEPYWEAVAREFLSLSERQQEAALKEFGPKAAAAVQVAIQRLGHSNQNLLSSAPPHAPSTGDPP